MFVPIRDKTSLIIDNQENVGKKREKMERNTQKAAGSHDQMLSEFQIVEKTLPHTENMRNIFGFFTF